MFDASAFDVDMLLCALVSCPINADELPIPQVR